MPAAMPIDPTRCPLCGQPNGCAMADASVDAPDAAPPCWCARADFSPELLARVPEAARRLACICARCAGEARHA